MNPTPVTIYSTDRCPACTMTKKKFDSLNVPYQVIDASDEDRIELKSQGFSSMPVVKFNSEGVDTAWAGFNMNKIKEVASKVLHGVNSVAWA